MKYNNYYCPKIKDIALGNQWNLCHKFSGLETNICVGVCPEYITQVVATTQARQRHSYLKRFPHGWAVEKFLKTNLKNKRAYARKHGYLEDKTNWGREGSKDDEDEDDGASDLEKGDDGGERTDGNSGNSDPEEDNIEDIQDNNEGPSASASNENDDLDDIYQDA